MKTFLLLKIWILTKLPAFIYCSHGSYWNSALFLQRSQYISLYFYVVKRPEKLGAALNTERLLSARLRYIIHHKSNRTGCGFSGDILGIFWELFFGLFLGRYMGLPRLFCGVLFQIIFIVTLVEYIYVPFKFRSGLQEKTHHSMVTVLCQINIFCHQLTPSTTTDFVRFSKQKVCKFWTSE